VRASPGRARSRSTALALSLALVLVLGSAPGIAAADLFAEVLGESNIGVRRVGGPDAIAGLGDWVIGNGTLCAAVSAPDHESTLSDRGGVLIDVGHCGRADDQWVVLQPMVNLSRANTLPVESVRAEVGPDSARLIATGQADGLELRTDYTVDRENPSRIRIETRVVRRSPGTALFLLGDVALHGHRQLTAFTLSLNGRPADTGTVGFAHPAVDVDDTLAMVDAMLRADTQVLIGASALEPEISYGWRIVEARVDRANGEIDALAHVALNGEHFSILGVYADTLWFGGRGKPGVFELAQTLLMDLEPGDELVYSRELIVGGRADVASVTDQLWSAGRRVVGRVEDATAGIHVHDADGSPVTFARPTADGRFEFRLPPDRVGEFEIRLRIDDAVALTHHFSSGTEATTPIDLGVLATRAPALLLLPAGEPMRIVFKGVPPTPDPIFGADGLVFMVGDERVLSAAESNWISLAGVDGDPLRQRLPAGQYRVLASRGPEWSVSETRIELAPGERRSLAIEPPVRLVEQTDHVSADLHVHSESSDDSALPMRQRIAAFVAQGAQVLVSTEHDNVIDYAPTIEAMGVGDEVTSIVGVEVTSTVVGDVTPYTSGHANAFPLVRDPDTYRGDAPRAENRRLRNVIADLQARPGRPILQLNHPRESGVDRGLGSYLSHLGVIGEPFDPTEPLSAQGNAVLIESLAPSPLRDLDFDVIELLNGSSMDAYRLTRAAWFSLILQGEFRPGTANSDSHDVRTIVALPRNYVAKNVAKNVAMNVDTSGATSAAAAGDPGAEGPSFDQTDFITAVRAGRLFGSTGPLLDVRLGDARPGGTITERVADLQVHVRSAQWVPVDEIRVFIDGALRHRGPVPEHGVLALPLRFEQDAFVTVEVEGRADPTSIYSLVAPGFTPFAFTNPIFVDVDGNPGWTPPGLPDPLPVTIRTPLQSP